MYHLAQFNIAKMNAPLETEIMREFREGLEPMNALAERSPGYIWHLRGENGSSSSDIRPYGEDILINLSVWEGLDSLKAYTYSGPHFDYLKRRKEWFAHLKERFLVLWWVPAGHQPTLEEAMGRLEHLHKHGPTEHAFTIAKVFDRPHTPTDAKASTLSEEEGVLS
ncbi:MAG: DUF3291 domain-containing protein [Meiothermus sp.]|nr:DUF3291 domain-containing protein [Meiothermus sp.]